MWNGLIPAQSIFTNKVIIIPQFVGCFSINVGVLYEHVIKRQIIAVGLALFSVTKTDLRGVCIHSVGIQRSYLCSNARLVFHLFLHNQNLGGKNIIPQWKWKRFPANHRQWSTYRWKFKVKHAESGHPGNWFLKPCIVSLPLSILQPKMVSVIILQEIDNIGCI